MFYNNITYEVAGDDRYTIDSPHYSFVGILKRESETIFRLPIGYPVPENKDKFNTARDLHIKFYKLFRLVRDAVEAKQGRTGQSKIGGHTPQTTNREDKDCEYIMNHDEGEVHYYRKLDAFDSLLDAYDPVRIIALENRLRIVTDEFDIRNFHRALGGAVFFDDHSFYIDKDYQPRPTLTLATTDIVGLYSFLLSDMRAHLYPDNTDPAPLHPEVLSTAEDFQARHLWPAASCWEESQWEATKATCIDLLDTIHKHTALKDEDYWKIYEAIERFLFDNTEKQKKENEEDGEMVWGLEGFWPVWEFLCLNWIIKHEKKKVAYLDPRGLGSVVFKNLDNIIEFKFNDQLLYPDAVLKCSNLPFKFKLKIFNQFLSEKNKIFNNKSRTHYKVWSAFSLYPQQDRGKKYDYDNERWTFFDNLLHHELNFYGKKLHFTIKYGKNKIDFSFENSDEDYKNHIKGEGDLVDKKVFYTLCTNYIEYKYLTTNELMPRFDENYYIQLFDQLSKMQGKEIQCNVTKSNDKFKIEFYELQLEAKIDIDQNSELFNDYNFYSCAHAVTDFKYKTIKSLKREKDIIKQYAYEYILSVHETTKEVSTISRFYIPKSYEEYESEFGIGLVNLSVNDLINLLV